MTSAEGQPRPTYPPQPLEEDIWQGNPDRKAMAFTSDIEDDTTVELPRILDLLDQYSSKGTFFIQGAWAEANPDQLRQIIQRGHAIGNHSWSHKDMVSMSQEEIADELQRTEEVVQRIAVVTTKPYWRCPLGSRDKRLMQVAQGLGYLHGWLSAQADPREGDLPERAVQFANSRARNGAIYLYHPRVPGISSVVSQVMQELHGQGYAFQTLTEISSP